MNFSDIIRIPFGYLLDWLYQFAGNYGVALILFSLIVKIVLLPMNAKSKKSMLKMSRVAPLAKALEAKYKDDPQRYQQEQMKLYKEEGISPGGGCLWSFIPLFILFPLYNVIRDPITYMMHIPAEQTKQVVEVILNHVNYTGQEFYQNLFAAQYIGEYTEQIIAAIPTLDAGLLKSIDFTFLGINLANIPTWKVWTVSGWAQIGGAVLAVLSGASNLLSMWVNQKMTNSVATDEKGQKDEAAAKMNQSMNTMMYMMPIMSIYFGFIMPAAITVYWIAQAIFTLLTDTPMTLHYRKVYAAEDEQRRERAAAAAALEAEKERLRAERRAANPDGIVDNTSKKKLERKEREEREAAIRRYELEKAGIDPDAVPEPDREKCPSGIPERPYCKGRNYDPDRYKKNGSKSMN